MNHSAELRFAQVLLHLGEPSDAEREVAKVLERGEVPRDAMSLLAKIKHVRGELSAVVACWAQLQTTVPADAAARQHIAALLRLALDPVRHAGEFVALGASALVQKPVAYLELEAAFHLFVARRPAQARAHCAYVARRYRALDPAVYKLAVLSDAWICEQMGAVEEACAILEQLGVERGFEHDLDRILTLAALYEKCRDPVRLRAALTLYHFVQSGAEAFRAQGHLAQLYRTLGDREIAEQHDNLHLEAFRRRMFRMDRLDAASVAAERYLPIFRLAEGRFEEPLSDAQPGTERQRAVLAALGGDLERARPLFERGGAELDRRYAADVDLMEGRLDRGVAVQLAALEAAAAAELSAADRWVAGWLLDADARTPHPAVRRALTQPSVGEPLRAALRAAAVDAPADPRPWRWLAQLARICGRDEEAERCARRLEALERARAGLPIGRVFAAAAYYFAGKPTGIIHELWASRERVPHGEGGGLALEDIHGNVRPEMLAGVRNVFVAVRQYARVRFPHRTEDAGDYRYSFKVTKEDEESGGLSAGLPTALAFLSVLLQQPCSQLAAASGAIVVDAHDVLTVAPVGDVDCKVRAAYHRELEHIVLPAANRSTLETTPRVPRAVIERMVIYATTLDDAVRHMFGEDAFL